MTNNFLKIFPILILLFLCCSKQPMSPETGTLTGTVYLEGQTDHSGISVALYKLAELDTTILRYNREYPNVGFPISQATEFDHRLGKVVAESKINTDGSFKIENIPEGSPREINNSSISRGGYNFVVQKQGYGWKYIYNIPTNSNSMTKLPDNPITLLGEVEVQGTKDASPPAAGRQHDKESGCHGELTVSKLRPTEAGNLSGVEF